MTQGARESGLTIQYCMPYTNMVLKAAELPEVTNVRATRDYQTKPDTGDGTYQWSVGPNSVLYWALGFLPFKDGFYSSTSRQTGGQNVFPELSPDWETLFATLSVLWWDQWMDTGC